MVGATLSRSTLIRCALPHGAPPKRLRGRSRPRQRHARRRASGWRATRDRADLPSGSGGHARARTRHRAALRTLHRDRRCSVTRTGPSPRRLRSGAAPPVWIHAVAARPPPSIAARRDVRTRRPPALADRPAIRRRQLGRVRGPGGRPSPARPRAGRMAHGEAVAAGSGQRADPAAERRVRAAPRARPPVDQKRRAPRAARLSPAFAAAWRTLDALRLSLRDADPPRLGRPYAGGSPVGGRESWIVHGGEHGRRAGRQCRSRPAALLNPVVGRCSSRVRQRRGRLWPASRRRRVLGVAVAPVSTDCAGVGPGRHARDVGALLVPPPVQVPASTQNIEMFGWLDSAAPAGFACTHPSRGTRRSGTPSETGVAGRYGAVLPRQRAPLELGRHAAGKPRRLAGDGGRCHGAGIPRSPPRRWREPRRSHRAADRALGAALRKTGIQARRGGLVVISTMAALSLTVVLMCGLLSSALVPEGIVTRLSGPRRGHA